MKSNKRKVLCILTAFAMAFTVFGCTGLSFAEESAGDDQSVETMGEAELDVTEDVEASEENAEPEGDVFLMGSAEPIGVTALTLKWDAVAPDSDHEGWAVYYVLNGGTLTNQETTDTTYKVTGLKANTQYTFTVQAYECEQYPDVKDPSNPLGEAVEITAKTKDYAKPSVPKANTPTSTFSEITFSWTAVAGPNGGVISYEIYDSKTASNPIKSQSATTWKKDKLSQKKLTNTYYIKAVETLSDGTVIKSEFGILQGTLKNFKTQKLTGLVSDPGYQAVLLQWNKMDGATGYEIYWRQGGERGNIDTDGRDSDGHWMKTFRSSKTKPYVIAKKPGKYTHLTTVDQPSKGSIVTFDKRGLDIMNHTYVYFYQFMIIPYYKDVDGTKIYTEQAPGNQWKTSSFNETTKKVAGMSNRAHNVVRNNTVLPMYVYETAKYNKPIYKTSSMNDGKKRGRLHKGHKFICWDKANGRVKFYGKKDGSGQPGETYWFAQKNAHTIQGYYMDNCRYGGKTNLKRKDWKTGYSKKTVLDYVNHCGIKSKTNYFVWASKYAQHVYILKKDKKTGKWALLDKGTNRFPTNTKGCWSNLCASGKVSIQSRNGHYVIFGKQYKANRSAYDYYCLSKLHRTVRLHSLLYKNGAKFGSNKYHNKVLGNPISKGCIRMRPYAAQWIYKNVPKKTRTLVY